MVLISSNHDDVSTTHVLKWLALLGKPYHVLYEGDDLCAIEIENGAIDLKKKDGSTISIGDLSAYWYRRGRDRLKIKLPLVKSKMPSLKDRIEIYHSAELEALQKYVEFYLTEKTKHINEYYSTIYINKLTNVDIAKKCGFLVPEYLITSKKTNLLKFLSNYPQGIISKPIENPIHYVFQNGWIPMYTEDINNENIDAIPDNFVPSLFQQKIDKKYELRVFCFSDKKYSMAIFSQLDSTTKTDFRKYNFKKPNRNVPFILPCEVSKKLDTFLSCSNFNSGSFDLLVDKDDNYYFLEINPVGQFGMVSQPCNFQIEKEIALYL